MNGTIMATRPKIRTCWITDACPPISFLGGQWPRFVFFKQVIYKAAYCIGKIFHENRFL
jgi:hypothetical protein